MKASVWFGAAPDAETLEALLTVDATPCDGDALGSAFSRAAGRPELGSAIREQRVLPAPTSSARELLSGLSFADALLARLPERLAQPASAVVVFYGVDEGGAPVELDGVSLASVTR